MNTNEHNENPCNHGQIATGAQDAAQASLPHASLPSEAERNGIPPEDGKPIAFVTRTDLDDKPGSDKRKLLMLGGGLLAAILFFVLTAVLGKSPHKDKTSIQLHSAQQSSGPGKGSVTPLAEMVRKPTADDSGGQLSPNDIRRTRTANEPPPLTASAVKTKPLNHGSGPGGSLASVPSFADTQQKWEDPKPYGGSAESLQVQTQQQNALREPSLVFVRSQTQAVLPNNSKDTQSEVGGALLQITPGTRIQAKLETQISSAVSAPVVAVIEYTYAIGDQIVIPSGARVYGELRQTDRSGYVDVKFDEIELLDGAREKIDAIGAGLDLGPIKGSVFGKNTGRNFLIRAASGLGSVAAMIVGNNTSAAFSEGDLLRERVAENIGTAGDTELMNLNANSRVVVSVPADTKIYVIFTKHEETPSTLHKLQASGQ